MNGTSGGPTAEISPSTPAQAFSQLVKSLEKYESEVTEHGLNDGFGVLGEAQVSTEMRFNTVSRHKWLKKKKKQPLVGNELSLLMQ